MGYKKMKQNLGFAEFALASSMKHNRSLKNMEALNRSLDRASINTILLNNYNVGTAGEGADAYPLLLQKWFHIDSDPELENQINDRLSLKNFCDCPSANVPRIIQYFPASANGFPKTPRIRSTPKSCASLNPKD